MNFISTQFFKSVRPVVQNRMISVLNQTKQSTVSSNTNKPKSSAVVDMVQGIGMAVGGLGITGLVVSGFDRVTGAHN